MAGTLVGAMSEGLQELTTGTLSSAHTSPSRAPEEGGEDELAAALQTALRKVEWMQFDTLSAEEKERVSSALVVKVESGGLCTRSTPCDSVLLLISGGAVVEEETGEVYKPGSLVHLESLLFGSLCSRSTLCTEDGQEVRLAELTRDHFQDWAVVRSRMLCSMFPLLRSLSCDSVTALEFEHRWMQPGESIQLEGGLMLVTYGIIHDQLEGGMSHLFQGHVLAGEEGISATAESFAGCAFVAGQAFEQLLETEMDFAIALSEITLGRTVKAELSYSRLHRISDAEQEHTSFQETQVLQRTVDEDGVVHMNQYTVGSRLGRGATACVYTCRDLSSDPSTLWALKVVDRDSDDASFLRELEALRVLRHPNILSCHEAICSTETGLFILEYASRASLLGVRLSIGDLCSVMRETVSAVRYMHSTGFSHGDIKPGNILRDATGHVRLADFGCACSLYAEDDAEYRPPCGTMLFMSPEACSGQGGTASADVWSLGCAMYCMYFGAPPFSTRSSIKQDHLQFNTSQILLEESDEVSNLYHFLRWSLSKSAKARPTPKQMLDHPFLL